MDNGEFKFSEARFAEHVEIPREVVADTRRKQLRKGEHWKNVNATIVLNARGIGKLAALLRPAKPLDFAQCTIEPRGEKKEAGEALSEPDEAEKKEEPRPLKVKVVNVPPNPFILFARSADAPEIKHVRVRSNLNFMPGMELPVVPDPSYPGFYTHCGPLPRRRGEW